MSITYPTTIDDFTNVTPGTSEGSSSKVGVVVGGRTLANFINDHNDAIEALQAKLGIDSSAVTTSHDYKLGEVISTDVAVGKSATQTVTNKTMNSDSNTFVFDGDEMTVTNIDLASQVKGITPLANGGTGAALVDPNADSIMMWDDSESQVEFVSIGSGLTFDGSTLSASSTGLTAELTASMDLTAGDMVGIPFDLENGVSKALMTGTDGNHTITWADTLTNNSIVCSPISSNKLFVVYEISTNTLQGVIITYDKDTHTVALGTSTAITTDSKNIDNYTVDITTIGTDKVAIAYISNADGTLLQTVICTVSGTTITAGTPQTAYDSATNIDSVAIDKLDTDKYLVFGDGTNHVVVAATVATTTSTFGSAVATGTSVIGQPNMAQIDTNKAVIHSNQDYIQIYTVSGTVVTAGTQQATGMTGSNSAESVNVISHTTDAFVMRTSTQVMAATVSGTVATFGSEIAHVSGSQGTIYTVSSTKIYVTGSSSYIKPITISGTTLTLVDNGNTFSGFQTNEGGERGGFFQSSDGYWAILNNINTTTAQFTMQGYSPYFLGICQSTVSAGASATVLLKGEDTNQSGLLAGITYEINFGGVLNPRDGTAISSLGRIYSVVAKNSTTVIL